MSLRPVDLYWVKVRDQNGVSSEHLTSTDNDAIREHMDQHMSETTVPNYWRIPRPHCNGTGIVPGTIRLCCLSCNGSGTILLLMDSICPTCGQHILDGVKLPREGE